MAFLQDVQKKVEAKSHKKSHESVSYDNSLNGLQKSVAKKVCSGYRFFEGNLVNTEGVIVKKFPLGHLGCFSPKYYAAQEKYEKGPWAVFDTAGNKLFTKERPIHHEAFFHEDTLITFDKEVQKYRGRMVDFDVIVCFDMGGEEIWRYSLWEHFTKFKKHHKLMELDMPFIPIAREEKSPWGGIADYYRLNSLQIIPKNTLSKTDSRFQAGNWVLTFRHGSLIFILDKETKEIVYKMTQKDIDDELQGPHGAQVLENGNMLVFDNGRYRGWSRVVEVNPVSKEIVWEYRGVDFFSVSQGYAQRLPNGNTLITESEKGRAIEVTPNCAIVWEYNYPLEQNKTTMPEYPQSHGKRMWMYRMTYVSKDIASLFIHPR